MVLRRKLLSKNEEKVQQSLPISECSPLQVGGVPPVGVSLLNCHGKHNIALSLGLFTLYSLKEAKKVCVCVCMYVRCIVWCV